MDRPMAVVPPNSRRGTAATAEAMVMAMTLTTIERMAIATGMISKV